MLWRPLAFTPQQKSDQSRHSNNFQQIARLKPGGTIHRGQQEIDALNAANLDGFPSSRKSSSTPDSTPSSPACRTIWSGM